MSSKECETQLNELLEAWDLDEATLNQTDIEAIKHLLLENQMQQDVIISYKTTNLDQAVDIQQLEQENKQLKGQNKQIRENNEELKRRLKSVQDKRDSHKCIRYKQQKALQDIKKILDTLETYSSNQDVLNDYNKRASKIRDIVNKALGSDSNE